jgi:hypothetical protein
MKRETSNNNLNKIDMTVFNKTEEIFLERVVLSLVK